MSPGTDEAFLSIVGMSQTRNLMNGPVQYITKFLVCDIYGNTHVMIENTQTNEISGVAETNWEQFFIYLYFNCTIQ